MTATGNDCYFYYAGTCYKGDNCNFRHQPAAIGSETSCDLWKQGICTRPVCEFRHAILNKGTNIVKCLWESQPSGCLKPNCTFFHTKPRPLVQSIPNFNQRPPFPGSSANRLAFRAPMIGQGDMHHINQDGFKMGFDQTLSSVDKQLSAGVVISGSLVGNSPAQLTVADGVLGNPPIGLLGPGPNPLIAGFADPDKSFQEHVKLFKQMLNRHEKQESPTKKEKEKSKRRVIPKHSRNSDNRAELFPVDKVERRSEKRENSKKKKSRDKSKKFERKERSYKHKGKSERKRREDRPPKQLGDSDFPASDLDNNQDNELALSDFSASPKSRHSSSNEEDLDFGVKSYEEILREKALRNLLEKKKMRELNDGGNPDESNRAKIEEIMRELEEVSKPRYKKETGSSNSKETEEDEVNEESDNKVEEQAEGKEKEGKVKGEEKDVGGEDGIEGKGTGISEVDEEKEEGELDDLEDKAAEPSRAEVVSPVSSEISLQADDEILSFGEEEEEKKETKKLEVKQARENSKAERKEKREKKKSKLRAPKESVKTKAKEVVARSNSPAPLNKSLDLGIKSFEEIMQEKRQRKKPEGETKVAREALKSVIKTKTIESSQPIESEAVSVSSSSTNQAIKGEKKGRKLVRKVMLKGEGEEKGAEEVVSSASATNISKQSTNVLSTIASSGSPTKEVTKTIVVNETGIVASAINNSTKDPVAKLLVPEIRPEPQLKVKSFEEIMREKRQRQQQRRPEETKDVDNEISGKVEVSTRQPGTELKLKRTTTPDDGARARRFMAGTAVVANRAANNKSPIKTGPSVERTRRLLLKRPSTKQKAAMAASENPSAQQEKEDKWDLSTEATSSSEDTRATLGTVMSYVCSADSRNLSTSDRASAPSSSFHVVSCSSNVLFASSHVESSSTSKTVVTSSCNDTNDSYVARVSPFLYNATEMTLSSSDTGNVSSTGVSSSGIDASVSNGNNGQKLTNRTPPERRRSDSSRKRRSNENTQISPDDTEEDPDRGPSPTKRVKSSASQESTETINTAPETYNSQEAEALDSEEKEYEDLLSDDEIEREIANLSPLSGEDYEDMNEDDLLMEVEALINE